MRLQLLLLLLTTTHILAHKKDGDGDDDYEDDWLLEVNLRLFGDHRDPVLWNSDLFSKQLPGVRYVKIYEYEEAARLRELVMPQKPVDVGVPVLVELSMEGLCGLLEIAAHNRESEDDSAINAQNVEYSAIITGTSNAGPLSDDMWMILQDASTPIVEQRLAFCTMLSGRTITRKDVWHWLNSPGLHTVWVNQRPFLSHWKLRILPIGFGPDLLLNRHGVRDIFLVMNETVESRRHRVAGRCSSSGENDVCNDKDKDKDNETDNDDEMHQQQQQQKQRERKRPVLLGLAHSWDAGRDSIYLRVNENFNGTLENKFCGENAQSLDTKTKEDWIACVEEYRATLLSARFCLSPRGIGSDCYRHWESLLLGCIPVMETGPLNKMFHGLPAVFIDSWEDLTPERLEWEWQRRRERLVLPPKDGVYKLRSAYWEEQVRRSAVVPQ